MAQVLIKFFITFVLLIPQPDHPAGNNFNVLRRNVESVAL
jgi:hypothetical protein